MNDSHSHFKILEIIGSKAVRDAFGLSSQALWNWKTRGIPDAHRLAFAQMLLRAGQPIDMLPAGFLPAEAYQLLRLSNAIREAATAEPEAPAPSRPVVAMGEGFAG